jgi:ribosome-associated heat shock protein Hsp15
MSDAVETGERNRLDKWLWCARFYKTRSVAAQAITGGKAHLNGERVKPAHLVRVGDTISRTQRDAARPRKVNRTMSKRRQAWSAASVFVSSIGWLP